LADLNVFGEYLTFRLDIERKGDDLNFLKFLL